MAAEELDCMDKMGVECGGPPHSRSSAAPLPPAAGGPSRRQLEPVRLLPVMETREMIMANAVVVEPKVESRLAAAMPDPMMKRQSYKVMAQLAPAAPTGVGCHRGSCRCRGPNQLIP